jgi:heme A synthase
VLPSEARVALNALAAGVVAQVTLGISTLMLFVPVHLAATHQVPHGNVSHLLNHVCENRPDR